MPYFLHTVEVEDIKVEKWFTRHVVEPFLELINAIKFSIYYINVYGIFFTIQYYSMYAGFGGNIKMLIFSKSLA